MYTIIYTHIQKQKIVYNCIHKNARVHISHTRSIQTLSCLHCVCKIKPNSIEAVNTKCNPTQQTPLIYYWLISRIILHCDVTAGHTHIHVLGCRCWCNTMVLQLEGCMVDMNCVHIGSLHHKGTEWAFINSWAWPRQMDGAQDGQTVHIQVVT